MLPGLCRLGGVQGRHPCLYGVGADDPATAALDRGEFAPIDSGTYRAGRQAYLCGESISRVGNPGGVALFRDRWRQHGSEALGEIPHRLVIERGQDGQGYRRAHENSPFGS